MKKLVLILSLSTLVIGTALTVFILKFKLPKSTSPTPVNKAGFAFLTNGITLNGIPCSSTNQKANTLVMNFVEDNISDETQTAIWVGKTWLDSVRKYLDQEKNATSIGANGVRIYFAKSANGQGALNTIVITSTHPNVYPYTDYYIHNPDFTTFLNAVAANPPNYFTEDHTWNDKGSLFFNSKYKCPGEAACASTGQNNIPCQTAYTWVQNFVNPVRKNYQAVNTESELFTIDFIDGLDDELNPTPSSLPAGVVPDGFRIYFAKSMVTSKNLFIIVPTQANGKNTDNTPSHLDNFTCFAMEHVLGPNDNGEQCPNNCDGVTLPQPQ